MLFLRTSTFLTLAVCADVTSAAFSNVTQLGVTTIAFGSAATGDGVNAFWPGSNGGSVGVYETFNSGATVSYDDTLGPTASALILMTAGAAGTSLDDAAVLVAGLGGAALSSSDSEGGVSWVSTGPKGLISQDAKYNPGSALFSLTGTVAGTGAVALLSSDRGASFTAHTVTGLFSDADIRYGSYPTADTFYVTAGFWGESSSGGGSTRDPRMLTHRLKVGASGALEAVHTPGDYNTTGAWAQVAKTTDGGVTWAIVFEDFESDLYPNDISCFDANTCTFVMEGAAALPRIYTTTDGGATWAFMTDTSGGSSLMIARMTGPTEAFVAGGGDVGRLLHTTDLVTWEASTTTVSEAATFVSLALAADNTVAYATGVLRSQLCSILKLDLK